MKIKCLAVDDEEPALDLICSYIQKTPFLELIGSSKTPLELLHYIEKEEVDLVFTDIEMPGLSGLNFSRSIDKRIKIIFTTAYDQYAIEGYKVNAFDYLLKPISFEEFYEVAENLKEYFSEFREKPEQQKNHIFVSSGYKLVKVNLDDILFLEGYKDYVKFHLASSDSLLLSLTSLKLLESELPRSNFVRVHRSYIVNVDKINSIERKTIHFERGYAKFSSKYEQEFFEKINSI